LRLDAARAGKGLWLVGSEPQGTKPFERFRAVHFVRIDQHGKLQRKRVFATGEFEIEAISGDDKGGLLVAGTVAGTAW